MRISRTLSTQDSGSSRAHRALSTVKAAWLVALITALGLGLRVYGLAQGLPYEYVPDESTLVGGALRMGATQSLRPDTFVFPIGGEL